jgi:hypothetical protein
MVTKPLRAVDGELTDSHRHGELANGPGVETADVHPGTPSTVDQSVQPFEELRRSAVSGADESQHPVRLQAAKREQQRMQGRPVRPLCIVEDDGNGRITLKTTQELDQGTADRDGISGGDLAGEQAEQWFAYPTGCGTGELIHDAEGDEGLHLLAIRPENVDVAGTLDKAADQCALADPRGPVEQHDARTPGTDLLHLCLELHELSLPSDEGGIHASQGYDDGSHGDVVYTGTAASADLPM